MRSWAEAGRGLATDAHRWTRMGTEDLLMDKGFWVRSEVVRRRQRWVPARRVWGRARHRWGCRGVSTIVRGRRDHEAEECEIADEPGAALPHDPPGPTPTLSRIRFRGLVR